MSNPEPTLTATNIRYLLVMNELDLNGSGARSVDIAERLGVTKPSVYTMINALSKRGLVTKERYEAAHLTPKGKKLAAQYARCFGLLYGRIENALSFSADDCLNAVCAILAQTKIDGLSKLYQRLCES